MLLYTDGKTEYGMLEAVRPTGSVNPSYARFILNAGTEKRPYFRVVRGSDFGPGGAETLHEMGDKHTKFNIFARKKASRDIGRTTVKVIGPYVELPRAPGYAPKLDKEGKSKDRQQDFYVRVQYHTDSKNNPLANVPEFPNTEWLNRPEFMQLVGTKYGTTQDKIMRPKFRKRRAFFEECIKTGKNPETLQPLSEQDKLDYPWLLGDGYVRKASQASKDDDEEDMTGVHVDGDGESEMEY
jgi:hypothetical protein